MTPRPDEHFRTSDTVAAVTATARRWCDQSCGLALVLEIVGERWTLLIVRELTTGPKRYSELGQSLRGIGTNLLTNRVQRLEADGVVRRRLLSSSPSVVVYELTDKGRELARAVIPLAVWGARNFMDDGRRPNDTYRPQWLLALLTGHIHTPPHLSHDVEYEFRIDDTVTRLRVGETHRAKVVTEPCTSNADVTLTLDSSTAAALVGGRLDLTEALETGLVTAAGDATTSKALLDDWRRQLATQVDTITVPR